MGPLFWVLLEVQVCLESCGDSNCGLRYIPYFRAFGSFGDQQCPGLQALLSWMSLSSPRRKASRHARALGTKLPSFFVGDLEFLYRAL